MKTRSPKHGLSTPHARFSQAEAFEAEVEELDSTGSHCERSRSFAGNRRSARDQATLTRLEGDEPSESVVAQNLTDGTASEQGPQSASVRDQGGRYPHRSSRRMRRRRGGSRFGLRTMRPLQCFRRHTATGAAPAFEAEAPGVVHETRVNPREPRETVAVNQFEERITERPDRSDRVMPSISDLLKAGSGDHRPDCQGTARPKRRSHHVAHCPARPLCRVHAQREPSGRFAQSIKRRRTSTA